VFLFLQVWHVFVLAVIEGKPDWDVAVAFGVGTLAAAAVVALVLCLMRLVIALTSCLACCCCERWHEAVEQAWALAATAGLLVLYYTPLEKPAANIDEAQADSNSVDIKEALTELAESSAVFMGVVMLGIILIACFGSAGDKQLARLTCFTQSLCGSYDTCKGVSEGIGKYIDKDLGAAFPASEGSPDGGVGTISIAWLGVIMAVMVVYYVKEARKSAEHLGCGCCDSDDSGMGTDTPSGSTPPSRASKSRQTEMVTVMNPIAAV